MLKTVYQKWEELKLEKKDENEIYTALYYLGSSSITNLYFSIFQDKMIAYIEFTKETLMNLELPNLKGINIVITEADFIDPNKKYIKIENHLDNEDIFIAFTSSLADVLSFSKSYFDVYDNFVKIVREYKDYFANPNFSLNKYQEQGLCAELIELSKIILKKGEKSILNWMGPSKNKRDFVFCDCSIEVKSTTSQINPSITITNENQLDISYPSTLKNLFLSIYIMEDDINGHDIIYCANEVLKLIDDVALIKDFKIKLLKLKVDLDLYKPRFKFKIQKNIYYKVTNDFPKIIKENIGSGIFNVSYKISIDELGEFIVNEGDVYEQF